MKSYESLKRYVLFNLNEYLVLVSKTYVGVKLPKSLFHCHHWLFPPKIELYCAWIRFNIIWSKKKKKVKKSKHVFLIFLKVCIKDDNVMCPNLQTSASPRSPLRPSIAPLPGCQWEAPGEAAWNSRLLVGKWHLQLNAARLPCQCVLVK